MNNFSFKYDIKTTLNKEDQVAFFEMNRIQGEMVQKVETCILNLKEQACREALIKLGWTPPPQ